MALLAALGTGLLGGCRSTQTGEETPRPGPSEEPMAASTDEQRSAHARLGYRLDWRGYPASPETAQLRHFTPLGDVIVFHDTRNNLSVLENATGRIRWSLSLGSPLTSYPGHARFNNWLVTASDTEVRYFDLRTGNLMERNRLHAIANSGPLVMNDLVVFGSATGEAYAIRAGRGFKAWGHKLSAPITVDPVRIDGSNVAFVSDAGDVIIIDVESGSAQGRRQRIYDGLETNPVTDGRVVYLAGMDQSVWAFNAEDGRLRWRLRTETPLTSQPAVWGGMVLIDLPRRGFSAIDTSSGEVRWSNDRVSGEAIAVRAGEILVWDGEHAYLLDPQRGDVVEKVPFSGFQRVLTDGFEDGALFTIRPDGTIDKYTPST